MMSYKFNDVDDMITLAREIQTKVYWRSRFYDPETDNYYSYEVFWDHARFAVASGKNAVSISEHDDVEFLTL